MPTTRYMNRRQFLQSAGCVAVMLTPLPKIAQALTDPNNVTLTVHGLTPGTRVAIFNAHTMEEYANVQVTSADGIEIEGPMKDEEVIIRARRPGIKPFQCQSYLNGPEHSIHVLEIEDPWFNGALIKQQMVQDVVSDAPMILRPIP